MPVQTQKGLVLLLCNSLQEIRNQKPALFGAGFVLLAQDEKASRVSAQAAAARPTPLACASG